VLVLSASAGRVEALFLPATTTVNGSQQRVMIFGHGNGELTDYLVSALDGIRGRGIGVVLVEYPGYGRSTGSPSERSVRTAMDAAYDRIARTRGWIARVSSDLATRWEAVRSACSLRTGRWCGITQCNGILYLFGLWPNGIAEPDVHLQALANRAESSIEHDSDARVFVLRANGLDIEARRVNPIVFDVGAANGGDIAADGLRVATAMCE
jgi:hypothetical protein